MRSFAGRCSPRDALRAACLACVAASFSAGAAEVRKTQGVVVLNDGRAVSGIVSEAPGGYRIDVPAGTYIVVPFTFVKVTADSLEDAYEALRDSVRKPTAEDHLLLADWCCKNRLFEQAKTEVTHVLRLEPLRTDARNLLLTIEKNLAPAEAPELPQRKTHHPQSLLAPERSSAGLTREAHQEFIRQVQPLLLNKCSAACHGESAGNALRLSWVRIDSPGHRAGSRANLETILQFIDFTDPKRSLLLTKPGEPTDVHRDLFLRDREHRQFTILERWVRQVVREADGPPEGQPEAPPRPQRSAPAKIIQPAGGPSPSPVAPSAVAPSAVSEKRFLERIRNEQLPDPFDPDVFNRRVHGKTAREYRESKNGKAED